MAAVISQEEEEQPSKDEVEEWNKVAEATFEKFKANKHSLAGSGYAHSVVQSIGEDGRFVITVNGRDLTRKPDGFHHPCDLCGQTPCKVQRYMHTYIRFMRDYVRNHPEASNCELHKAMYTHLNAEVREVRGKGNRKRFPCCLERCIRVQFPNKPGTEYVGFKPSGKKRTHEEVAEGESDDDMEEWEPLRSSDSLFFKEQSR